MPNDDRNLVIQAQQLSKRETVFADITSRWDQIKSSTVSDISTVQAHYEDLSSLQTKFEAANEKISDLNVLLAKENSVDTQAPAIAFNDILLKIKAKYLQLKREEPISTTTPVNNASQSSQGNFSLPPIQLPSFGGKIEDWPDFFALFQSLVHNNASLTPIQRFHFLRTNLKGSALSVIANFQLTTENYELAFTALVNRYQDPRRIAQAYLNKILQFKPITSSSLNNLKHFLETHQNSVQAIKALAIDDLANFILLTLSLNNLDPRTSKAFEELHSSKTVPLFDDLLNFVTRQIKTLEIISPLDTHSRNSKVNSLIANSSPVSLAESNKTRAVQSNSSGFKCIFCQKTHSLSSCSAFFPLSRDQKIEFLKKHKRCFNCLGPHLKSNCKSTFTCRKCNSHDHHTLLHPAQVVNSNAHLNSAFNRSSDHVNHASSKPSSSSADQSQVDSPMSFSCITSGNTVTSLLGTFRARIFDSQIGYVPVRGVIDPGSQLSFISKRLFDQLSQKMRDLPITVSGIGGRVSISPGTVLCDIFSRLSQSHILVNPSVVPHITNHLPSTNLTADVARAFEHLLLADPDFHRTDKIDLLLGADVYPQLLLPQPFIPSSIGPIAINTIFGWTIIGPIQTLSRNQPTTSLISACQISQDLHKFWEVENIGTPTPLDPLHVIAEQHFTATHKRNDDGRYSVALPVKPDATPLAGNQKVAHYSLTRLIKRLDKTPSLKLEYDQFLREYLDLGHMSVPAQASSYVIPHHVVTKLTNQGSKIRVVFNASSPDSTGLSLNDRLIKGPKLQLDVSDILLNFRFSRIALCCDVRQMYRQVLVHEQDRHMQHIYWKPEAAAPVQEAELNTVTYGLAPSAFLAVRVLHQLVQDEGHRFPLAAQALLKQTYIDDIVTGANDIHSAIDLRLQLKQLLSSGGFELRKWSSSHPQVLRDLPPEHLESTVLFNDEDNALKILGLSWEPSHDCFVFRVQPFQSSCTKRNMLSFIARIFDPIGFLSPITISLKIIIQKIWLAKLDWDEPVTSEIELLWKQLINHLDHIALLHFPRCVLPSSTFDKLSLVGFADASSVAYAAVLYICFETPDSRHSFLWKAKTRVAPLKTLSIPRLELCAAVLLIDLVNSVQSLHYPQPFSNIRLFSDSEIVLAWLHTPPHTLKTFVSHRIAHITNKSPSNLTWSHCPTSLNPADMASRGLSPLQFAQSNNFRFWTRGPSFLTDCVEQWPPPYRDTDLSSTPLPEVKATPIALIVVQPDQTFEHFSSRFSSFIRFQRVVAWMRRFASNCRSPKLSKPPSVGPLAVSELQDALLIIILRTQAEHFSEFLPKIRADKPVKPLCSLTPFIDTLGVLRVGGRLKNAGLNYNSQHPILLPKSAHVSELICKHYHLSALHAGPTTCQALVRTRYWILSLRQLIRKVIHRCLTCHRFRASTVQPIMADLPSCRVQPGRPFLNTGVDFAGPFQVRASRLRKSAVTKGYLCVFVCTATKAVHLEFASELSTDVFLAALDRFIARRGLPHAIRSDQGRNFVGANKRLQEIYHFLNTHHDEISSTLSNREIEWIFNPPLAPNFGGLWEAAVKSTKTLLYRLSAEILFTAEEYATLFARIEAILNSRPLCSLSSDPNEASTYLSPGHFLIGAPLLSRAEIPLSEDLVLTSRWKTISKHSQYFWRRWSREYLNTLTQRSKWTSHSKPLKQGDVVVIKGMNTSPLSWPIARVSELKPGQDGVSRVAILETSTGSLTRPVNKLIPLPE